MWDYGFFLYILAKENSPSTLNRKGRISMPKPYLTSQQLRQYVFPICFFPTSTKDMKGTKFMQSILKELYPNLLSDFESKCGLWFFLNFCRASMEQGECIWKGGKEIIKPSCVHAPPPVHDVVQYLLFFNGGVAHPHTSLELNLLFIQRQKLLKI